MQLELDQPLELSDGTPVRFVSSRRPLYSNQVVLSVKAGHKLLTFNRDGTPCGNTPHILPVGVHLRNVDTTARAMARNVMASLLRNENPEFTFDRVIRGALDGHRSMVALETAIAQNLPPICGRSAANPDHLTITVDGPRGAARRAGRAGCARTWRRSMHCPRRS